MADTTAEQPELSKIPLEASAEMTERIALRAGISTKFLMRIVTAYALGVGFLSACGGANSAPVYAKETAPTQGYAEVTQIPVSPTEIVTQAPTSTEVATPIPTEVEHLTNPNILLLGDSMFAATYVPTDISSLLKNSGIDVNFIGDKKDAGGHIPIDGFSGFDTAKILSQLQSPSWEAGGVTYPNTISEHVPDIVVIQLGTNDLGVFKDPVAEYTSDISKIIQFLRSKNPRVEIIVSTLIPSRNADSDEKIKLINEAIPGLVLLLNLPGSPVVATPDLRSEWKPGDFFDDYHPNITGSEKMAKNDFDTLINNGFVGQKTQALH